jgi:UrcA family protein
MRTPALWLAASLLAASAAHAQTPAVDASQSAFVRIADLDLTRLSGARAVLDRIQAAATSVCGPRADIRDLNGQAAFNHCRTDTISRAVARLNAPLVTALAGQARLDRIAAS